VERRPDVELAVTEAGKATVVAISVDIDAKSAPELQAEILPLVAPDRALVLDVSRVAYMSSAGLRMLLSIYRQAARSGARLLLAGLSPEIREVMSATGFLDQFTIYDDVESAVKAVGEG
jgi:anti-sigma B factor antagonist